jgi:hypothetical protein
VVEVRDANFFEAGTSGMVDTDSTPTGQATPASELQPMATRCADENQPATGIADVPAKVTTLG